MKSIYNILIAGILCLFVNSSAIAQYEITPTQGAEVKNYSDEGCYCNFINDYDALNRAIALYIGAERAAWLREREAVIKDELDKRFNTTFGSFGEAQRALFESIVVDFKEVDGVLSATEESAKFELKKKKREGDKYFYESKTLGHRIKEIDDGINGSSSQMGDLKTGDVFIKNLDKLALSIRRDEVTGSRWAAYNLAIRNGKILDGLPKISNDSSLENRIINAYIANYNSKDIEQRVRAMLKYMIRHNIRFGNDIQFYQDTNLLHPNNSHLVGEFGELAHNQGTYPFDVPVATAEEEIKRFAISKLGDLAFDFIIPKTPLKNKVGEYLKYHRYEQGSMSLATDIFKHYGDGRFHKFPHNQYNYGLDSGSLFSITFQDVQNKNRLFLMNNHNAHQFKKFNGLGNVLSSLAQLPKGADRDDVFIGDFMIEILKDNNFDMSGAFNGQQAFNLFHFRTFPYENFGRYSLGVDFNEFRGTTLWDNDIRFPSFLEDPIEIDAILAHEANDLPQFEHLLRVRDLAKSLSLNKLQTDWLRGNVIRTNKIKIYLGRNGFSPTAIQTMRTIIRLETESNHLIDATQDKDILRTVTYYNDGVFDSEISFCGCSTSNIQIYKDYLNGVLSEAQLFSTHNPTVEFQIQNADGTFRQVSQLDFYLETASIREGVIREILAWSPLGDITETGYELYDGNYGMAAANVGLLFIPFDRIIIAGGKIVKIIFRKGNDIVEFTAKQMWALRPFSRGRLIEEALAKTHYKDYIWTTDIPNAVGKPNYFWPYFDFIKGNKVVSVKTTNAISGFGNIKKNIEDLALYVKGSATNGGTIIDDVDLDVWVPEGYDHSLLEGMRNLAESLQINFNILEFK